MVPDVYVRSILAKYDLQSGESSPAELAAAELMVPTTQWAGRYGRYYYYYYKYHHRYANHKADAQEVQKKQDIRDQESEVRR